MKKKEVVFVFVLLLITFVFASCKNDENDINITDNNTLMSDVDTKNDTESNIDEEYYINTKPDDYSYEKPNIIDNTSITKNYYEIYEDSYETQTVIVTFYYDSYYEYDSNPDFDYEDYNEYETTTRNNFENKDSKTIIDNSEKENRLATEYERHDEAIRKINSKYDTEIQIEEDNLDYWYSNGGTGSASSYASRIESLKSEAYEIEKKIAFLSMDTSGANKGQVLQLQREVDEIYNEIEELEVMRYSCQEADKCKNNIARLKQEKNQKIAEENEIHKSNLEEINQDY